MRAWRDVGRTPNANYAWMMDTRNGTATFTRKGLATRDRIIAVASRLTYERGIAGTSTADVETAAGVSASQLYHYFADKQSLIRAVIAYQTVAVLQAQEPYLSSLDSLTALRAWRDLVVSMQQLDGRGGCPLGSISSELPVEWNDVRIDLAASFALWEDAFRRGLQAMSARGELVGGADPDALALALLAAVQGGLLLTQVRRDTAALEAALDAMLAHLECLTSTHA